MVADRNFDTGEILGSRHGRVTRYNDRGLANAIGLAPHDSVVDLRRLIHSPMAGATDVASIVALAAMSFLVALEGA
jgi:hypothetical protein